jgi:hypothetical protein
VHKAQVKGCIGGYARKKSGFLRIFCDDVEAIEDKTENAYDGGHREEGKGCTDAEDKNLTVVELDGGNEGTGDTENAGDVKKDRGALPGG